MLVVYIRSLALADCAVQDLFKLRNGQLRGSPCIQVGTLSHQQEQLQQVGRSEDSSSRSPGPGTSSEDLAPYLGEKWKAKAAAQGPAEVGM